MADAILFPNGGFESGSGETPDGWSWPSENWIWDNSIAHNGVHSARVNKNDANSATVSLWSANVSVKPSTAYTLTYWIRTQNATAGPTVSVYQYTSSNSQTGFRQVTDMYVGDGSNDWMPVTFHFQTMPDADYIRLRLYLWTTANGTYWFDDFTLDEGPQALYPFQIGFPVKIDGFVNFSSPAIADIDHDGDFEVLVGDGEGLVQGWDHTGMKLPNFPLDTGDQRIVGQLALADLDGNLDLEIVAGTKSPTTNGQGQVFIWHHTGEIFSNWPQTVAWNTEGSNSRSEVTSVVIADIDGDDDLEILAGTTNNAAGYNGSDPPPTYNLYAWQHNGNLVQGNWPTWARTNEWTSTAAIYGAIAAGDLNGDGINDIITGRDHSWLYAYSTQGEHLPNWPVLNFVPPQGEWDIDPHISFGISAPVLADLEGDGSLEYIIAGKVRSPDNQSINSALLVYEPEGTRSQSWSYPALGNGILYSSHSSRQAPAIADLDHDGRLEIVVATLDGWIRTYKYDKTLLWEFDYTQGDTVFASEPVIGDIDGDNELEIVFNTYDPTSTGELVATWGLEANGNLINGFPLFIGAGGSAAAPTLTDLDGDGDLEIAVATQSFEYALYVWDTPAPYNPTLMPWPMGRQNLRRTALYERQEPNFNASTKTANPPALDNGNIVTFTIRLLNTGTPLTTTMVLSDAIPPELNYITGTLQASLGNASITNGNLISWSGISGAISVITIAYAAQLDVGSTTVRLTNTATLSNPTIGNFSLHSVIITNPYRGYLPLIIKS